MTTAVSIAVADAVVAELASDDFKAALKTAGNSMVFTPERSYADWKDELEGLDCLKVDVVPVNGPTITPNSRELVQHSVPIDIAVRKRLGQADQKQGGRLDAKAVDALVLLVQQIGEWFLQSDGRRLTDYDEAFAESAEVVSLYNREWLRDKRLFFGVVRVTFSVSREPLA